MALKINKLVLAFVAVLQANAAYGEDLLTVYQQALESDPILKAAEQRFEIYGAQKGQAFGAMLPQVTATANYSANSQRQQFTNPHVVRNSSYPGTRYYLSASQTLMNFAAFWNWRKLQELENQGAAEYIAAQHTLIYSVVEKYFNVLESEDQYLFFQSEKQTTEKQLEQVKRQYAKQMLKITDVYEVEAALDALKASEIEAETLLVTARESLKELTNATTTELLKLREDIEYKPLDGALDDWIAVARSENPALAATVRAMASASNEVARQKSRFLPVVDLQLNYYDTNTGYQSSQTPETQVQVAAINVSVPIFSGGTDTQMVYEAQHKFTLSQQENESKLRGLVKETSDAFLSSNASVRRINASLRARESAIKSREAKEKGFTYGVETVRDVLLAEQAEFQAKRDLSKAKYSYIKNRIRFMRSIGMVSVENLQEINEWLVKSGS